MHKKFVRIFFFLTRPDATNCLLFGTIDFSRFVLTMINNLSIRTAKEKSAISVQFKSKIQIQQKYRIFKSSTTTKKERLYNMAYHCCWLLLVKRVRLGIYLSNTYTQWKNTKKYSVILGPDHLKVN